MILNLKTDFQVSDKQLFTKVAGFTDIHYGRRGNDKQANQDNSDFVDWFIEEAQAYGADVVVFCGDWHDNRNNINVSTMNASLADMEKLAKSFKQFIMIPGNHDLFYRDRRDINSVAFGKHIEGMTLIKEPTEIGGCAFMPWLIDDEWKKIPSITSKYMFGHFELPTFLINSAHEFPDTGTLRIDHFKNQDWVFSGHFHKRQIKGNIIYTGNAFPFNFGDAGDDNRGAFFMEWGNDPTFKAWPNAPKYRVMKASELLENLDTMIEEKSYNRVSLDVEINYTDAQFIKETVINQYKARRIDLVPMNKAFEEAEFAKDVEFKSIDQIVVEGLNSVDSKGIDNERLVKLYESLK